MRRRDRRLEELDDGRFNIVLMGSNRYRIVEETEVGTAYRCAEVDITAFDDDEPPRCRSASGPRWNTRPGASAMPCGLTIDWAAVTRLDDEMLVNAIAQVAPFDVGAKRRCSRQETLDDRADLLVQLMQFHRAAVHWRHRSRTDPAVTRSTGP